NPGEHTGIAVLDLKSGKIEELETMLIHNAMEFVEMMMDDSYIVVEDKSDRDSQIWNDYLEDYQAFFTVITPKAKKIKMELISGLLAGGIDGYQVRAATMIQDYTSEFVNMIFKQFQNIQ